MGAICWELGNIESRFAGWSPLYSAVLALSCSGVGGRGILSINYCYPNRRRRRHPMIDRQRLLRVANRPLQEQSDHNISNNHVESRGIRVPRRRTEDVEYWRKRAGWFDDDIRMGEYNNGVYDTFYQIDDDGSGQGSMFGGGSGSRNELKALAIKVAAVAICLVLCILMFRIITRRLGDSKKDKKKKKSSSASRSRSKSRSRSRSRARKKGDGDYDLLNDDGEKSRRSTRSSRSKSRSRRSRSRSRARSHSRSRREKTTPAPPAAPILV